MLFLTVMLGVFYNSASSQDLSLTADIKTLSELPLEKLLHLKKSFHVDEVDTAETKRNSSVEIPLALALQSKKNPKDRGAYHVYYHEDHPKKDSKSSLQSIFQISVTTLAFLAFGGYLICLLVQAVKGKPNYMSDQSTTQIMSALVNSSIRRRRRRPTRAPLSLQRPTRPKRPTNYYRKRKPRPKRDVNLAEADVEDLYYSLINLSEGYARYHTEDYLNYNVTSRYF